MTPTIGSLCTGYGGLDQGVHAVYGGRTAWVSDIDKGANKILAHRYPDAPNIADFTTTDWSTVEPIDILTAGFPCQPVSNAGKRLGDDDERWLWDDVLRAVRDLRPGLAVLENVRGLLTARGGRLFGRVLGTLAHEGYDARWCGLRAADIGAPHGRWRIFIAATDTQRGRLNGRTPQPLRGPLPRAAAPWGSEDARLLPSPRTSDTNGPGRHGDGGLDLRTAVSLLPTPAAQRAGRNRSASEGAAVRWSLDYVQKLLPTPKTIDRSHIHTSDRARALYSSGPTIADVIDAGQWGQYGEAVARWEIATRHAPAPTELSPKGTARLAPTFSEWMMGLPAGWVTDVPDITRNEALKALGNGVVPQQAAAALQIMADW